MRGHNRNAAGSPGHHNLSILRLALTASQSIESNFGRKRPMLGENNVPLVVALIAGTILLYGASAFRYHGFFWADQVCQLTPVLCASPHWVGFAAAAVAICYFFRESLHS
jgi:hypothetical protein